MINTNWGGVVEDNSFGTHEFMELCRQVGCKPYINGNVGSGTVQEMAEAYPLLRIGKAEEIAHVICSLVSPQNSFMTGSIVAVDGGITAKG